MVTFRNFVFILFSMTILYYVAFPFIYTDKYVYISCCFAAILLLPWYILFVILLCFICSRMITSGYTKYIS